MAIEDKIRRVGIIVVTYPWMRRYVTVSPLVNRSVKHTAVASATTRTVGRAADTVSARRRPKAGPNKPA